VAEVYLVATLAGVRERECEVPGNSNSISKKELPKTAKLDLEFGFKSTAIFKPGDELYLLLGGY